MCAGTKNDARPTEDRRQNRRFCGRLRSALTRLAALHSFFSFVADREPLAAAQCAAVLRIPNKKMSKPEVSGLDEDEITAILAQPNRSKAEGQRDHVLLAVLYNTGARIQEALDLSPQSVRWKSPFQVRLLGKGRKERHCPLWPETVALLQALLKRTPRGEGEPIFVNRYVIRSKLPASASS